MIRVTLLAALFTLALGLPAALAQFVVIESAAPGIAPGLVVEPGQSLTVPAGASVTLIGQDGTPVTLTGPYQGAPEAPKGAAGGSKLIATLSHLVGSAGSDATALGAMRAAIQTGNPPSPWAIDVDRSGAQCAMAGSAPKLWMSKAPAKAVTLKIKATGGMGSGGGSANVSWAPGATTAAWPDRLALDDGADYLLRVSGGMNAAKVTIRLVPDGLPSDAHKAAWMADQGCESQARALLASLN
ncbi:MAG: hypothetical protein KDE22_05730 [Rhodobacterales bacterium]|nr:hypothetical protein [Rhodobacterales bacterium]